MNATITYSGNDTDGYRWHLSQPGKPGTQSDTFRTIYDAKTDFMCSCNIEEDVSKTIEYKHAIEVKLID